MAAKHTNNDLQNAIVERCEAGACRRAGRKDCDACIDTGRHLIHRQACYCGGCSRGGDIALGRGRSLSGGERSRRRSRR